MRRVTYLPKAFADLREITLQIAEDNPDRAIRFVEGLRSRAAETSDRPGSFSTRDELAPKVRVARHGRHLILFQVAVGRIEIIRLLLGARDLRGAFDA